MAKTRRAPAKMAKKNAAPKGLKARSTASVQKQLEQSVKALLKLEPSQLETLLGQQVAMISEELGKSPSLSAVSPATAMIEDTTRLAGPPEFLRQLGQRFVKKFGAQMYSLLCDKNDPDNAKVVEATKAGAEKLALMLAGYLVVGIGLLPGIATAIAVLVAKRVVDAAHDSLCEQLKASLPA
jgi:hypothetical protein